MATSAWKSLETLTAWSDDMSLRFELKPKRRLIATFKFVNFDEFFMWEDYNRGSYLVYASSPSLDALYSVDVTVDIGSFMELRFKHGMRGAPKVEEPEV